MKISLLSLVMFFSGGILVYSGVKGYDPRDVIQWGLGGKQPVKMKTPGGYELGPNEKNPNPGERYPGDLNVPDPSKDGRVPA